MQAEPPPMSAKLYSSLSICYRDLCCVGFDIAGSFGLLTFAVRRAWDFPLNEFEIQDEDRIDHRNQQQGDESGAEHAAHLRVTHRFPQRPAAKGQWDERNH